MSTPTGCSYRTPSGSGTNPEGVGKRQLFFSYRTVSLRLPGSYTTPFRCGYEHPYGCSYRTPLRGSGNATFNACTCTYNFGHFSRDLGQNCRLVFLFDRHPSGPLDPSGHTLRVWLTNPQRGWLKKKKTIFWVFFDFTFKMTENFNNIYHQGLIFMNIHSRS